MIDKDIDTLILKAAKVRLYPYGISQKEDALTWIDDNKLFLTIIKFTNSPLKKTVSLNIGLNFLWYAKKNFTIDFLKDETSITYEENDDLYSEMLNFMQTALNKAINFRKFRNLDYSKEEIMQINYNIWKYNYYKMIICFLCDDYEMGIKYFALFSENIGLGNEDKQFIDEQKKIYGALLKNNDKNKIKEHILNAIEDQRKYYNQNYQLKLK